MNCREVNLIIDDYLNGRPGDANRARLERHLAECENCRIRVENDTMLIGLLKRDEVPDPGDTYWDHLEKSILSRTTESHPEITAIAHKPESKIPQKIAAYLVPLAASFAIMFLSFSDVTFGPDRYSQANLTGIDTDQTALADENEIYMERYLQSDILGSIIMAPPGSPLRIIPIGRFEKK